MIKCKNCNQMMEEENMWEFDQIGKTDWTPKEMKDVKQLNFPTCEECVKPLVRRQ